MKRYEQDKFLRLLEVHGALAPDEVVRRVYNPPQGSSDRFLESLRGRCRKAIQRLRQKGHRIVFHQGHYLQMP